MKRLRPLVIGNWKMNPQSKRLAVSLAKDLKKSLARNRVVDVVLAPPTLFIDAIDNVRNGSKVFALGLQDVHYEKMGAHTGEVSTTMAKDAGASFAIVGHSERRASGETDEVINKKLRAVIKAGMTPILCIGETKRDSAGHYLNIIESQIRTGLAELPKAKLVQVVITYEPVWAISKGDPKHKTATASDVHEMRLFIEKVLTSLYGRTYAQKVRILYGGSVNEKNATELYTEGSVDGFLVGGASLKADSFTGIVQTLSA